ncbi:MAG: DNA methylase, partial [Proteobacteria bacterium]|nr:DNA methylase [Pseudomonadota bacterium]
MDLNTCHFGDCRELLGQMADAGVRVQTCVTSPPYFGLRDYGMADQIGLEDSPNDYVAGIVRVFALVRSLLSDDGTVWLNLGDSYCGSWGNYGGKNRGRGMQRPIGPGSRVRNKAYEGTDTLRPPTSRTSPGIKNKDLFGIPWRVA